ncbi:MAG: invasin domain 3-containing protein, partial [Planctomycetota bacterium]
MNRLRLALLPIAVLLALIAVGGNPQRAAAYVNFRTTGGQQIAWNLADNALATVENNMVRYVFGTSGTDDPITTGRYNEFAAIRKAFDLWNVQTQSDWRTEYIGGAPSEVMGNDGVNTVFFDKTDANMDAFTLGQTVVTFTGTEIVDGDIRLNDPDFNWDTADGISNGQVNRSYIENTMVHEIGHFFGIDHSMISAASMLATSPNGAISAITPHTDDIAGNGNAYGNSNFSSQFGRVDGNVTKPGGGAAFGVHVSLIDLKTWEVVVGDLTDVSGNYSIKGVPPGRYWLIASPVVRSELSSNSFWDNVLTAADFMPEVHGVAVGAVGVPDEYLVAAGATVNSNTSFTLSARNTNLFEEDDTPAQATTMAYGEAAIAHITSNTEVDAFGFNATAGDVIDLVVISNVLRAKSDLRLRVKGTNQVLVINSVDDAVGTSTGTSAYNVDPISQSFTVPAGQTGTLYLEVLRSFGSANNWWYLATVQRPAADNRADEAACQITIDKPSLTAGGVDSATVTVEVRNKFGDLITDGSVPSVTLHIDGSNDAMTETPANSGLWKLAIAAKGSPEDDVLTATVNTTDILDTVTLHHVGAVSGSQSSIVATPDSLFADGASKSEVRITPRDSGGRLIHDSTLTVVGSADVGTLSTPAFDSATGEWVATFTASTTAGTATIGATIGGTSVSTNETIK